LIAVGTKHVPSTASNAVADFADKLTKAAAAKPFKDDGEIKMRLELPGPVELRPFRYDYTASEGERKRRVTVVSPLKWVASYVGYDVDAFRQIVALPDMPRDLMRRFLVHTVLLDFVVSRHAGLGKVLEGLRYRVSSEAVSGFGGLPFACVASVLPTVRPPDRIILDMVEENGLDQVAEVISVEALSTLRDPLGDRLSRLRGARAWLPLRDGLSRGGAGALHSVPALRRGGARSVLACGPGACAVSSAWLWRRRGGFPFRGPAAACLVPGRLPPVWKACVVAACGLAGSGRRLARGAVGVVAGGLARISHRA
jgi:hypothetical protein